MISVDLPVPPVALAIGAHSDDIEFGCGATLAKWAAAGAEVHMCVCTDGSKGTWDPSADLAALVKLRQEEQADAARTLGVKQVHQLGFVDGELDHELAARAAVAEVIRKTKPVVVLGHDPWKQYRFHPDHRHAGLLAIEGIVAARDPHFFPEQRLAPCRPETLLLFEAQRIDHVENVDGYVDTKIEALLCHRSQWISTMAIENDADRERWVRTQHEDARASGLSAGLRYGEAFARMAP